MVSSLAEALAVSPEMGVGAAVGEAFVCHFVLKCFLKSVFHVSGLDLQATSGKPHG